MSLKTRTALFVLGSSLLLAGCGGSGGGGSSISPSSIPSDTSSSTANETISETTGGTGSETTGGTTTPPVTTSSQTISFLHYNDLHAHLTAHKDLASDGSGGTKLVERGGLARLATLVKQQRAEYPASVLMNVGDTYHGGAEALFTLGNAIVDPVNALGIDVGVPGNWDFGFSSVVFRMRYTDNQSADILSRFDPIAPDVETIKKPNFPNLAANLTNTLNGELVLPATLTKEIDGVTVGFIGLTSDIVKHVYPLLAPAFDFVGEDSDPETARAEYKQLIETYANQLRNDGAVIVVVMSELGIHKDHDLAQVVEPGLVDVFFSAHTHEATFTPLTSTSGALVVEAGNDGYLGRMDITVENGQVTGREWELMPVDASITPDPDMQALVDKARKPFMAINVDVSDPMPNSALALVQPLDTVIATTDQPLDRRHVLSSHFNNAITDILRHYGETDVAFAPGFRFDSVIKQGALMEDNTVASGDITLEDVYRFFPLMFGISTAEVSGARLRELLETTLTTTFSPEAFAHKGGWLEGFSGLGATVNLANPDGERVIDLYLKDTGKQITDNTVISITGCKRPIEARDLLCTYSGFDNVFPLVNSGTGEFWTIIDLLIEGLRTGVPYDATRQDIIDIHDTPVWPEATFIQPVHGVQ